MTAKKKFYLVCETNIGPRSHGDLTPDNEPDDGRMIIQTEPGRKNTSHGWRKDLPAEATVSRSLPPIMNNICASNNSIQASPEKR